MTAVQKKLLLALALILVMQSMINLFKYIGEVEHSRFGGDFMAFWESGSLLKTGEYDKLYSIDRLEYTLQPHPPGEIITGPLLYPPTLLPIFYLFHGLSYNQAILWWSLLPLPFYYGLLFLFFRRNVPAGDTTSSRRMEMLTMAACPLPFLFANIFTGQTSAYLAVLLMGGFYFWGRRPWFAGICFGLMTIKPQLGLLLPIALIASRQWQTIIAAMLTALVMVAVVTLWFGLPIWQDYIHITQAFAERLWQGVSQFDKLALGPFIALHTLEVYGLSAVIAGLFQATISIVAVVVTWRIFRQGPDKRQDLRYGLLACATLLATPYSMVYDSPLLVMALLPLLVRVWRFGWSNITEILAFVALICMPYAQPLLMPFHTPFAALSLGLFFYVIFRRYLVDPTV